MIFFDAVKDCVEKFKKLDGKPVRIVGHLDSDGLSASSILIKSLQRENINFSLSIARQIDKNLLIELKREDNGIIFFVDLGSGYLELINEFLSGKKVFILDHHTPQDVETKAIHLNPHLFGIDGGSEISGAGVSYFFGKELNSKNVDLAYLALIGAIGDMQENKGFKGLNEIILEDAIKSGKIEIKKGLRMFGMQTKPLHKVLEYSTDPYIPNVTGSENGAKQFLKEIGIQLKQDGKFKKMIHLNDADMKKLITSIILKRLGSEDNPEDVLGPIYLLNEEDEENPTKDLKEFSTLLNACGRLGKPSLAIGACLGSKEIKKKAIRLLLDYKKEIISSLDWFYSNKSNPKTIIEREGYVIINAEDNVRDTLIGTLASIISKSNVYAPGTIIVSMAHTFCNEVKVSIRYCGHNIDIDMDLREIIRNVIEKTGGVGGGHKVAAGALIPLAKEEEFIMEISIILNKKSKEEVVR